jgi:hypothetical protein
VTVQPNTQPTRPSFAEFEAAQGGGSSAGTAPGTAGGTANKTSQSVSSPGLGKDFGVTTGDPSAHFGIGDDRYNPDIAITTSVGVQALPPEDMAALQSQLIRAGFTPSTYMPTGTLDDTTRAALLELKRTSSATGTSDLDTLQTSIDQQAAAAAGVYGADLAKGSAGGPSTSVNKTISDPTFTDPLTARSIVRDAMQTRLGRAPTADEYHQFNQQLKSSEGGQDVTTTTTHSDGQGHSTTRVRRSNNQTTPSPTDIADDFTRKGALGVEANTRTAGVDYYDALHNLIGGN